MPSNLTSRQAEEKLMQDEGRLPPGQVLTRKFPVLSISRTPKFDESTWTLRVFGEVAAEKSWSWSAFQQIPTVTRTTDIHCVTGWSKFDTTWEGPRFRDFVRLFAINPTAQFVTLHSADEYTTNLPLEALMDDDVLLAWKFDGKPLAPDHGYPLRLVAPQRYFWKSAKWVCGLEFTPEDRPGFWERAGYHNEGRPFKEERTAK
ncbi:sulfite oxidase-like oxidoreductase [Chloroflexota bacterium]